MSDPNHFGARTDRGFFGGGDPGDAPDAPEDWIDTLVTRAEQAESSNERYREALREMANRVEEDRHEPDKLLCHVQSIRRAALSSTGG